MLNPIVWVLLGTGIALIWTDNGVYGIILIVLALILAVIDRTKKKK